MKRREAISMLVGAAAFGSSTGSAKDAARKEADGGPRWRFLGDDDSLRMTIRESTQVLLICVYNTTLEGVKPPFATVVLHATVVQAVKGAHKLGDRVKLDFVTDSLPGDEAERTKFTDAAARKNLGSLKMAFLQGDKADSYGCEWLDVPAFDPEMLDFVMKNRR